MKKDIERKQIVKEEKKRKNKRKLTASYKDDPHRYIAGKLNKRFKSDKTNYAAYYKLIGQQPPSPPVNIKKQEPFC